MNLHFIEFCMLLTADLAPTEKQKKTKVNYEDQKTTNKKGNLKKIKDESIDSRSGSTKTLSQG